MCHFWSQTLGKESYVIPKRLRIPKTTSLLTAKTKASERILVRIDGGEKHTEQAQEETSKESPRSSPSGRESSTCCARCDWRLYTGECC